jgi:hypothetical protein
MKKPEVFTNREIVIILDDLKISNDVAHKSLLEYVERIEKQTQRTNGRVTKLELWRSGIVAGIAVLCFLIPLIWEKLQ